MANLPGSTRRDGDADATRLHSETLTDTFDAIRGDLYLYETGQVSYRTLMRGLRASMEELESRVVRLERDEEAEQRVG